MKKYILSTVAVLSALSFSACDDMLDTDPRVTDMTQATFPGKPADVEALNAATYSILAAMGGGDADTTNPFYWWEIMSDNCYGSGGLQDHKVKALHYLEQYSSDQFDNVFAKLYGGISRANNQIETIDNVDWKSWDKVNMRNQLLGEAYFMRAVYTLWLTQLYGNVPLITSTTITPEMEEEADAENVIYPQILSDLVSARNLMAKGTGKSSGHADVFAAEAFAARAWMFWAGFYKQVKDLSTGDATMDSLRKEGEEGGQEGCDKSTISKADIKAYLEDIKNNGGYDLLPDYRSLWQYSNSLVWDETQKVIADIEAGLEPSGHRYDFIADMPRSACFDQPGNGNGNKEEIFQIQFMNASNWGIDGFQPYNSARMYCNYLSCWWALRVNGDNGTRDYTYPFMQGWGQGTPSRNIWEDWTEAETKGGYTDIRKTSSLIDVEEEFSSEHGLKGYSYVKDDCEESGYAVKKWCGVTLDALEGDNPWWRKAPGFSASSLDNGMQGDHFEDFYLMRYADVLLMLSEITGDVSHQNEVRDRAHLPLLNTYSLADLQNDRRWEFAFEGLRFNDMRRWSGKGGGESCYAAKALQAQDGKKITNYGKKDSGVMKHNTCSWAKRYADTDGFLSKPQSQITLMNGKLTQNPGWDGANPEIQYNPLY